MKHAPLLSVLVALLGTSAAHAAPFTLSNASARDAAAQVADTFGVYVVYKSNPQFLPPVSFTIDDASADSASLQAVNALANATQSDFTKTFVVGKTAGDVPATHVDSTAPITFPTATMEAADAIRTVAGVDSASVQIGADVSGTVTLSSTTLPADKAAEEIAAQTHTKWKAFYALTPRTRGRETGGKVIGHTASGSPIVESPYVYYAHLPTAAEIAAQERAQAEADRQQAAVQAAQQKTADAYNSNYGPQNNAPAPNAMDNNSPYGGYNPYANPYDNAYADPYGGYGNGYGGFSTGGGLSVSDGYGGPIILGGGY